MPNDLISSSAKSFSNRTNRHTHRCFVPKTVLKHSVNHHVDISCHRLNQHVLTWFADAADFFFFRTGSTDITEVQFFQSLFSTINVTGEPSVLPCRMPEVIRTWSFQFSSVLHDRNRLDVLLILG